MDAFGWAVIRQTYTAEDDAPGYEDHIHDIVDSLRAYIGDDWGRSVMTLGFFNGIPVFQCLDRHHFRSTGERLISVFHFIAKAAPGSYGLLYLCDDDGDFGDDNNYSVLVLRRGLVQWQRDPFLSPLLPRVEDPLPGSEVVFDKYLPLGSVVTLRDGQKKLMVFGRCQRDTAGDRVFDYVGVPYPEGNIMAKATFLFSHEDITAIHHLGFTNQEDWEWTDKLKTASVSTSPTTTQQGR